MSCCMCELVGDLPSPLAMTHMRWLHGQRRRQSTDKHEVFPGVGGCKRFKYHTEMGPQCTRMHTCALCCLVSSLCFECFHETVCTLSRSHGFRRVQSARQGRVTARIVDLHPTGQDAGVSALGPQFQCHCQAFPQPLDGHTLGAVANWRSKQRAGHRSDHLVSAATPRDLGEGCLGRLPPEAEALGRGLGSAASR